jgi:AcrR family transcriptional regulator
MATTLRARKRQLVQDTIWDAAIDLFAQKGYDETTVEEIVAAAGVSSRSFFRYFASKSDLMARGVLEYGDAIATAIEACPRSWPAPQVFRHTVLEVARLTASHPRTRKAMLVGAKYPAARAAELARLPKAQERVARAYARRRGFRDDLTPALLAGLTFHVVGTVLLSWFAKPDRDIEQTATRALATLQQLLVAPAYRR